MLKLGTSKVAIVKDLSHLARSRAKDGGIVEARSSLCVLVGNQPIPRLTPTRNLIPFILGRDALLKRKKPKNSLSEMNFGSAKEL